MVLLLLNFLFIVTPIVGVCICSMFCCTLLYVHSSIAIILMGKRELIALLNLSSLCLVMVERLFLAVPRGCLQFVIVVFPDHTHLLFIIIKYRSSSIKDKICWLLSELWPLILYEKMIFGFIWFIFHTYVYNHKLQVKGGRALRGKLVPLWSQKLKVAFHQFHPIGLLEEWSKCKILAFFFTFSVAIVTKMVDQIGLK